MVPLTSTGPEVFVVTMTVFLSGYYYALEDTIIHMKSLKLKNYPGENITDLCAAILVDAECFDSYGAFNYEHLG